MRASIIPPRPAVAEPEPRSPRVRLALANTALDRLGFKRGSDGIRRRRDGAARCRTRSSRRPTTSSVDRTFEILQDGLREDRRQGDAEARCDRRRAFDAIAAPNEQVPELRHRDVGLGRLPRPGLHALGRDLGAVGRLERHRLLQQAATTSSTRSRADAEPGSGKAIVWEMQKYLYDKRPTSSSPTHDAVGATSKKWAGFSRARRGPGQLRVTS